MKKNVNYGYVLILLGLALVVTQLWSLSTVTANPINAYAETGQEQVTVNLASFATFPYTSSEWKTIEKQVLDFESGLSLPRLWSEDTYYISAIVDLGVSVTVSIQSLDSVGNSLGVSEVSTSASGYFYGKRSSNPDAIVMFDAEFQVSVDTRRVRFHVVASGIISFEGDGVASVYVVYSAVQPEPEESLPVASEEANDALDSGGAVVYSVPVESGLPPVDAGWSVSDEVPAVVVGDEWVEAEFSISPLPTNALLIISGIILIGFGAYIVMKKRGR